MRQRYSSTNVQDTHILINTLFHMISIHCVSEDNKSVLYIRFQFMRSFFINWRNKQLQKAPTRGRTDHFSNIFPHVTVNFDL